MNRIVRSALVAASAVLVVGPFLPAFAASSGLTVPRGRATAAATLTWVQNQWIGRCFPEFTQGMTPHDLRDASMPTAVRDTGTYRFALGSWDAANALVPGFLIQSLLLAQTDRDGNASEVIAAGYDAAAHTLVYARTSDGERFNAYVTGIDGAPHNLPAFSAALATNTGEPSVSVPVAASPATPAYADLARAFGRARDVREACGMREVRYENPDPMGPVRASAYHYVVGIYDTSGAPHAFAVGTVSL